MSHVPEKNLQEYRRLRRIAEEFESAGNVASGKGLYTLASQYWANEAATREKMQALREGAQSEPCAETSS